MNFNRPIIVIAGPTASGKSSLALKLAKDINGVIINADSRQIYKELNIGTAKPTPDSTINEKEWIIDSIPHFLYGFNSITSSYNIYEYQKDVQKILDSLDENQIPILTGGTGLYIDSVVFNYELSKTQKNIVRESLREKSVSELQSLIDSNILERLNDSDRNNPVRLIRLIERKDITNKKGDTLNHLYFVIDKPKDVLDRRISQRVDMMIEDGLIEECKELFDNDLFNNSVIQKTIGYSEFNDYFNDSKSLDEVRKEIVSNTIKYAKRQRTWFRRNKGALWINNYNDLLESSERFIKTS